ncbi:hypothetical protein NA57DRAFT_59204 [Rhizodiscina lignyota]|uniref:Uncharacterized protein n=1 Tax=Rhizodiscina lignyota TaxID=1504668 RepID=A0A9P4M6B4_9PEZI|nr:hypothetical protein NA57DRAFT_59204 [Rhizodiscina lignyota]
MERVMSGTFAQHAWCIYLLLGVIEAVAVRADLGVHGLNRRADTDAATDRIAGIAGGIIGAVGVTVIVALCFFSRRMRLKRERQERAQSPELPTFNEADTVLLFSEQKFVLEDWKKDARTSVVMHVSQHPALNVGESKEIRVDGHTRSASSSSESSSQMQLARHPANMSWTEAPLHNTAEVEKNSMRITAVSPNDAVQHGQEISRPTTPWPESDKV